MSSASKRQKALTGQSIRTAIDLLESVYGRPRFVRRFDPVEELVSCILSQHSADALSFPTFTRLLEACPTWQDVVNLGPEQLAVVIRKAGLANQKSKTILSALTAIKDQFGDYTLDPLATWTMKDAEKFLMSIPGVGPKTAAIVLCFGFGFPAIPVDTHVHRVSLRLGFVPKGTDANKAHKILAEVVPDDLAFRFHVALIQHGRLTCRAPKPHCDRCVLASLCPTFQAMRTDINKGRIRKAES